MEPSLRLRSKRVKREIISIATALGTLLIYIPFMGTQWGIYVAMCMGYTIAVFGLAWSDQKIPLFLTGRAGSVGGILQVHAVFLLLLILWIRLAQYSKPFLSDWVLAEGSRHESWFLFFALLGIVAMLLLEHWWLLRRPETEFRNF
jgi:hypothetical protein